MVVGHVAPEASVGGNIALIHEGDTITIDAQNNEINLVVSAEEITRRLKSWKAEPCKEKRGTLAKYAKLVSSASDGAITDGD